MLSENAKTVQDKLRDPAAIRRDRGRAFIMLAAAIGSGMLSGLVGSWVFSRGPQKLVYADVISASRFEVRGGPGSPAIMKMGYMNDRGAMIWGIDVKGVKGKSQMLMRSDFQGNGRMEFYGTDSDWGLLIGAAPNGNGCVNVRQGGNLADVDGERLNIATTILPGRIYLSGADAFRSIGPEPTQ